MASDEPDNAAHSAQGSPKEQQNNEIALSAKRLYGFANGVAQALAAVPYLHTSTSDAQAMGDLVQKIYALAAITSSFLESLMVESMTGGEDHKDMWSKDHRLRLSKSIEKCRDVFAAISHAVRIADERFQVTGVGKGENYLDGFNLNNQQQAQITIDECYDLVSQTNVIVKHTALSRIENLNTSEILEALRLSQTLQKPEMRAIWALKSDVYASKRLQALMRPVQSTTAPPTGSLNTKSASYRQSPAINIDHIKPMWAITNWPSTAGSLRAASAATPGEADKQEVKLSSSTSTVVPGDSVAPSPPPAPAPLKPGAVSFGQPSVIKPKDHMIPRRVGDDVSRSPFASWKSSSNHSSSVPHHLEAYIIQPMVNTCDVALALSYAVLPLPLSEQNMQAQIQKLGPDYSIMDSLIDLHPQVLKLMQSQTVQRQGDLVSIQHGSPSSFTVSSGTLQTSPVIFMISTTPKTPPQTGLRTAPTSVQETLGQQTLGQGPFANTKSNPFGTMSHPFGTKSDLFGTKANIFETKSGLVEKAALVPASAHHLASPEAYSKFLREQRDEICTYVERPVGEGLLHYQAITANKDWQNKNCSLEEIRLLDYNAGRRFLLASTTNPPLNNNAWDTWRASPRPSNMPVAMDGRPAVPINNTASPYFGASAFPPPEPSTVYANKSKSTFEHGNPWDLPVSNAATSNMAAPTIAASTAVPMLGLFGCSPAQASASVQRTDSFGTGPNTRSLFNPSIPPTNSVTGSGQTSVVTSSSIRLPSSFGEPSNTAAVSSKPATGGLFSANALPTMTSASNPPTFSLGGFTSAAQPASLQSPTVLSYKVTGGPLFASALSSTTPASTTTAQQASSQPAASSLKPTGGSLFASALSSTRPASNPPTSSLGGTSAAQPAASQPAAQTESPFTSVDLVKSATSTANSAPLPSGEAAAASGSANPYSRPSSFGGNKNVQDYQKVLRDWEEANKAGLFGKSGTGQLLSELAESQLKIAAGLSGKGAESLGAGERDGSQGALKKD